MKLGLILMGLQPTIDFFFFLIFEPKVSMTLSFSHYISRAGFAILRNSFLVLCMFGPQYHVNANYYQSTSI